MKKIICQLKKEDLRELTSQICNKQTFITLYHIYKENGQIDILPSLTEKINELEQMITETKDHLLRKYNVPCYVSQPMNIDLLDSTIYVDL